MPGQVLFVRRRFPKKKVAALLYKFLFNHTFKNDFSSLKECYLLSAHLVVNSAFPAMRTGIREKRIVGKKRVRQKHRDAFRKRRLKKFNLHPIT